MILLCGLSVLVIAAIVNGYRKGMVKIILSCIAMIATIVIVAMIAPTVTKAVKDTSAYEKILDKTEKVLEEQKVFSKGSDEEIIDAIDIPKSLKTYLKDNNTLKEYQKMQVNTIKDYIVHSLSDIILSAVIFIILFIIVYVLVQIIIGVLDAVAKLPVLKEVNRLGGIVVGAIEGLLIVWIFFISVNMFGNTDYAKFMFEQINESAVLQFLYENNLILKLILKFL